MRAWSSRVPDVMDALVARLREVTAGTGVTIHDGPWTEGGSAPQVIVVGFNGFFSAYQRPLEAVEEMMGTAAVSATGVSDGLGAAIRETFTISCASIVRTGNTRSVAEARRHAYDNIAVVGQVLTEPPRWAGGNVMRAVIGASHSLQYTQDRRGLLAYVPFSVECEGFAQQ